MTIIDVVLSVTLDIKSIMEFMEKCCFILSLKRGAAFLDIVATVKISCIKRNQRSKVLLLGIMCA